MPSWTFYGKPVWKFRDEKGRFVAQAELWRLSEKSIASTTTELREAALNLPPAEFDKLAKRLIKLEVCKQYTLGIGGKDGLTQVDYGVMGGVIADQYRYFDKMMAEYEAGNISPQEVARRIAMYVNSTREAFNRALVRARGLPNLEFYPGDGSCLGKTNCKCTLEMHFRNNRHEVYWVLGVSEHCGVCEDRAHEWSPLIVEV